MRVLGDSRRVEEIDVVRSSATPLNPQKIKGDKWNEARKEIQRGVSDSIEPEITYHRIDPWIDLNGGKQTHESEEMGFLLTRRDQWEHHRGSSGRQ